MRTLSVKELCTRYGVTVHTVLAWIRSGELRALNVGRKIGAKKPRWRITQEALEAFELTRMQTLPLRTPRRKRSAEVVQFYSK